MLRVTGKFSWRLYPLPHYFFFSKGRQCRSVNCSDAWQQLEQLDITEGLGLLTCQAFSDQPSWQWPLYPLPPFGVSTYTYKMNTFPFLFNSILNIFPENSSKTVCNTVFLFNSEPEFAGSNPAEAVGFFGRPENSQYAFLRRGSKRICPMSQLCGM